MSIDELPPGLKDLCVQGKAAAVASELYIIRDSRPTPFGLHLGTCDTDGCTHYGCAHLRREFRKDLGE